MLFESGTTYIVGDMLSRRIISGTVLFLLLVVMTTFTFDIRPVKASGTIYIRADGGIDPQTANITTFDNMTYIFTDNNYDHSIKVERNNVVIDGAGYILKGSGSGDGIIIGKVNNLTIKNVNVRTFWSGIGIYNSANIEISKNNLTGNSIFGIFLHNSSYNTISANHITTSISCGIELSSYCNYNTISHNNIVGGDGHSILLSSCFHNTVSQNHLSNNLVGITLSDSSNNTISGNKITNNTRYGIYLGDSSNKNSVSGNKITNNFWGIVLGVSSNNMLRNNSARDNTYNFDIWDPLIQDIDDSNTVNGKPIYYWINRQNMTVPLHAGCIVLINCTRITAKNLNLTKNGFGAILFFTTNSTIIKNNIRHNRYSGIHLRDSSNITISGNNITNNNLCGIKLGSCLGSTVQGNALIANSVFAIEITDSLCNFVSTNKIKDHHFGIILDGDSMKNTIRENNMIDNTHGILVSSSYNNTIYHNNFFNNQIYIRNSWGNAFDYNAEGNYWGDYKDRYPNSTEIDNSGIWDTPYMIDENNQDNYPLVRPYNIHFSDMNYDFRTDMKDIAIAAVATGSFPTHPRWNNEADVNQDGRIDMKDLILIASNFGKNYL